MITRTKELSGGNQELTIGNLVTIARERGDREYEELLIQYQSMRCWTGGVRSA